MRVLLWSLLLGWLAVPTTAVAQDALQFMEEFGKENLALDAESRRGKQACQQRHAFNNSPDRDSKKLAQCIKDSSEASLKRRCEFYVKWWHRSKDTFNVIRPGSYPQCASYFR